MDPGPAITISLYDPSFEEIARHTVEPFSAEIIHYWPSRIQRVGDYYILATMGRDPLAGFQLDTGDIYLVVLDHNFETQEWHQLSFNDPEEGGGMRPWFDIYEEQLVIGYDKVNNLFLFTADLNLDLFSAQNEPSEEPSEEPSGEPAVEIDKDNSGCQSNQASLLPLFLLPFGFRNRRT